MRSRSACRPGLSTGYVRLDRLRSLLAALPDTTRKRIALEQVRRCRGLTIEVRAPEREIRGLMRALAPGLLAIPGCSAISAARLAGQTAGFSRFSGGPAFAVHTGVVPPPAPSGKSCRHRLSRCGNRKLNSAVHMIAVTQARMHPPAMAYMERKQAEGMSYREALRCLKRLIARTVFKTMIHAEKATADTVVLRTSAWLRPLWRCRVGIGAAAERITHRLCCQTMSGCSFAEVLGRCMRSSGASHPESDSCRAQEGCVCRIAPHPCCSRRRRPVSSNH